MSALAYGHRFGGKAGIWKDIAASQIFHPAGGSLVYYDSNGRVTIGATATDKLSGWALVPRSFKPGSTNASNGYWTSSTTAGNDDCFVINDLTAVYEMPCEAGTSYAIARDGEVCDIVGDNSGDIQSANPGTSSTDVLIIKGGPPSGDTDSILVSINFNETQLDT